jgi:predicted signal transduction protein with EAL and GGDEF domain
VPLALLRAAYWLKLRRRVDVLSLDTIRRDLRRIAVVGPALAFAFSLAATTLPHSSALERFFPLFVVWIASTANAFCLTRLAYAAALIVFAASAPLVAALLEGGSPAIWLAAMLLVVSCLVIVMLGENYRAFAEIVRSRLLVAERHRAAEEAKEAATAIAYTDYLTSLPNRRWMQSLLASRVEAARRRRPARSRRLQADQRHPWASGRRRGPETGGRPSRRRDA